MPIATLPNVISLLRALSGPIVLSMIMAGSESLLVAAFAVMALAGASDFLDGFLARRLGVESELGSVVDAVCDSIYHLSVFLAFLALHWLPAWMLFLIYARELIVPYLRTFVRQTGRTLSIRQSGKVKSAVHGLCQMAVVGLAIFQASPVALESDGRVLALMGLATLASVVSLIDYIIAAQRIVRAT
ncbi:MAG: CDP-alcohol phosphatidyltransferase family protein [Hyphomicrobiaceae bacterium]